MEIGNRWPFFFCQQFEDLRGWPDNGLEPAEEMAGFLGNGEIAILSRADKDDRRILFFKKGELMIGERRMAISIFEFFGFFLGTLRDRPVGMDDDIVVIPHVIDLNPAESCFQAGTPRYLIIVGGSHQVTGYIPQ
jgi:hypothetical protein